MINVFKVEPVLFSHHSCPFVSFTQCSPTCGRMPLSQSTDWASSRYPHFLITVFARPTPVRSRLRARQQSQSSPDPAGKDSATSSPILTEDGTSVRLSFQSCSIINQTRLHCDEFQLLKFVFFIGVVSPLARCYRCEILFNHIFPYAVVAQIC